MTEWRVSEATIARHFAIRPAQNISQSLAALSGTTGERRRSTEKEAEAGK